MRGAENDYADLNVSRHCQCTNVEVVGKNCPPRFRRDLKERVVHCAGETEFGHMLGIDSQRYQAGSHTPVNGLIHEKPEFSKSQPARASAKIRSRPTAPAAYRRTSLTTSGVTSGHPSARSSVVAPSASNSSTCSTLIRVPSM